jgi:hypothetical protein
VRANNHGIADGEFDVSVADASGTVVGDQGGQVTASPNGNTDALLGKMFALEFDISTGDSSTGDSVLLDAELDADDTASSPFIGISGSYTANLLDTAQFLGVWFYADAAETIPLPDFQLGSALGFDYVPSDIVLSPAGPVATVPEASTWVMMLAGFGGLGALAFRRAAPRPVRP